MARVISFINGTLLLPCVKLCFVIVTFSYQWPYKYYICPIIYVAHKLRLHYWKSIQRVKYESNLNSLKHIHAMS